MTRFDRWAPVGAGGLLISAIVTGALVLWVADDVTLPSHDGAEQHGRVSETEGVDSLARVVVERAPFRLGGRPAPRPYDPMQLEAPIPEFNPGLPTLVVNGLVGGSSPMVLLEGIPGRDGLTLMAVGDTAGGLRVRQIKEGRVTINGMDTTWVLMLRRGP